MNNNQVNFEILNDFVNVIIMDVAKKYLLKLKKDTNKPPMLIKNYLDKSIFLLQKYKTLEISKMKNTISDFNTKEQQEFNKLFKEYQEYQELCQELNFAFILMIDEELQNKTLNLLYKNIYELKFLVEDEKIITKKQVDINSVIKQSNKKKINKLHFYDKNNYHDFISYQ